MIAYYCEDVVGRRMAGPGIRAVELSRRLAGRHQVTLVADGAGELVNEPFRTARDLGAVLRDSDAFIAQGFGFPLPHLLRFGGGCCSISTIRSSSSSSPGWTRIRRRSRSCRSATSGAACST